MSNWTPPPNWPKPEPGWSPPPGWQPDPSWGPAPPGWKFEQDGGNWFSRHKVLTGVLGVFALLIVLGAVGGGGNSTDELASDSSSSPTPSAPPSPSSSAPSVPPPTAASPSASQAICKDYPVDMARSLLTNSDTGQQRVPGKIGAAVSVLSPAPGFRDRPVYVIAISLDGKPVLLAHPVTDTPPAPTGNGLYGSLDDFSEQATGFPQNTLSDQGTQGFALEAARDCVSP